MMLGFRGNWEVGGGGGGFLGVVPLSKQVEVGGRNKLGNFNWGI